MPSIVRRKTSDVAESPFAVYAGDDPRPGGYRAILKQVKIGKSSGDNLMFKPILELKASAGSDKAKFDGYPVFPNIVCTDNESNKQREQAFYLAVGASKDPAISCDVDPSKFKPGDGQTAKVLKIDKVKPEGIVVNVKLRYEQDNRPEFAGQQQLKCDMIFASRDGTGVSTDEEDAESDSIEDDVEEDGEEVELYEEDDLLKLALPALRKILVEEFGEPKDDAAKIKSKKALVDAILAAQDEEGEDDDEEDEEDEEDEDQEEDDEDDEDPEQALREQFADLDRNGLKAAIKKRQGDVKFKTSQTDEDLLEILVELAKQDPPF